MAIIVSSVQFVGLDCSKTTINGMSVEILFVLEKLLFYTEVRMVSLKNLDRNIGRTHSRKVTVVMIEAAAALAVCGSPNTLLGWYLVNGYISLSLIR